MVDVDGINVGKIYQSTMDPILDLLKQCLETECGIIIFRGILGWNETSKMLETR